MKINKLPLEVFEAACKFQLLNKSIGYNSQKITDGVSSDIWHVKTEQNIEFCIKRALAKLTVKEDWYAPISRNKFEAMYFQYCFEIAPNNFPKLIHMSYNGPTWKFGNLLFRVDPLSCRCQIDLNPEGVGGMRVFNSNPGFSEDIYLILINQVPRFRPWSDNAANQWGNPYRICQINPYFPECRCKAKIRSCLPCNLARHLLEWYWYKT